MKIALRCSLYGKKFHFGKQTILNFILKLAVLVQDKRDWRQPIQTDVIQDKFAFADRKLLALLFTVFQCMLFNTELFGR